MSTFTIPTHVEIGPDSLMQLPALLKKSGHKVLLVHGHRPVEDGLLQQVRTLLNEAGFPHANMGQILPNPKYSSVKRGIKIARKEKCDIILALGGGSTLQCAKGIALGIPYDGDVWDFWTGKAKPKKATPVASVLTDPSTGTELSATCTLVRKGKQKKIETPLIESAFAILDPKLSMLPFYPTMGQCFDAFVHLFVDYFHTDGMQQEMNEMLMHSLLNAIHALEKNINDIQARNDLFWIGLLSHTFHEKNKSAFASLAEQLAFAYSLNAGNAESSLFLAWCSLLENKEKEQLKKLSRALFDSEDPIEPLQKEIKAMKLALSIPETGLIVSDEDLKNLTSDKQEQEILVQSNKQAKTHES